MFVLLLSGKIERVTREDTRDVKLGEHYSRAAVIIPKAYVPSSLWETAATSPRKWLTEVLKFESIIAVSKVSSGPNPHVDALVTLPKVELANMVKGSGSKGVFIKPRDGKPQPVAWLPKETTLEQVLSFGEGVRRETRCQNHRRREDSAA
eukprot:TRINITY_DN1378_c0_g1_i8.p1 TRINITY_DN1378_c0_g1~~TRINITY_DN1378_c0_g1_i8.p1  ORF type:complete len:150 (+),score=23.02 TRINITY_DN1378_c0_g1_i8:715-1164(+)